MLENQTEYVRARLTPAVKEKAEAIFDKLGLGHTDAIRLFYQQVILNRGLPFGIKIPNEETIEAMRQVKSRKGLKQYKTAKQLFDKYR